MIKLEILPMMISIHRIHVKLIKVVFGNDSVDKSNIRILSPEMSN